MNNNNSTFDYNKLTSYYPYGELPLKYTKQGQEQIKKELENNSSSAFFNSPNKFYNGENNKVKNDNKNLSTQSNSKADEEKPKNDNNTNDGFDFKTMLPLLSNFGVDNKLKDLIPLLSKGGNLGMNDLIKLFSNFNKTKVSKSETKIDDSSYIDNLKKVE